MGLTIATIQASFARMRINLILDQEKLIARIQEKAARRKSDEQIELKEFLSTL